MTIIGGADGPTQIYIASSTGWLNWFGLILVILILLPNMIWAIKNRDAENKCKNRMMNIFEQIGRYGCMFLMVFNIGVAEFGFASPASFVIYLLGNVVLLLFYWAFWAVYMKKPGVFAALMLSVLPALIFLLCGITLRHWLLAAFALFFGIAHIYVSLANAKGGTEG